jgi:UDP-N-acetylmuramoyl-tripeptide--D-alanyl-D-alanine ligase
MSICKDRQPMRWTIEQVAAATSGRAGAGGTELTGVSIDSRALRPGELFVAVKAERDGHEFAGAAAQSGAGALLVDHPTQTGAGRSVTEIVVSDTSRALLDLGRAARARLAAEATVVGITGSVGKTSTKDLAAAALRSRRTVANPRSFNNELGLPLTLANAPEDSEVVILEMGARGPRHIALLCEVARPSVGVVTAVAEAHTEMFGDLDGVAQAKGELIEALPSTGTAVLNGDDPRTRAMGRLTQARSLLYSTAGAHQDIVADNISLDAELHPRFTVHSPWGTSEVVLEARGAHQVANALAAIAVACVAGVSLEDAVAGMAHARLSPHRMDLARTPSGATILNDAYNANPTSMTAALHALIAIPAERHIAVLGPMAELGAEAREKHLQIAALTKELGVELIAVGSEDYGIAPTEPDAVAATIGELTPTTAVLVKASRVVALEKVAARLLQTGS